MQNDFARKKYVFTLFDILRPQLIIMVAYIHNSALHVKYNGHIISASEPFVLRDFVVYMISDGASRTAVPLFYIMSGYLFFFDVDFTNETYIRKIRSRIYTLLVPFMFWNTSLLLFKYIIETFPVTSDFINSDNKQVSSYSIFDVCNSILGLTRDPIAYQFWFIRDLIILSVLSPTIYFASTIACLPFIGALSILWIVNYWPLLYPGIEPVLFFSIGSALAIHGFEPIFYNTRAVLPISALTTICLFAISTTYYGPVHRDIFHAAGILSGIAFLVSFSTMLIEKKNVIYRYLVAVHSSAFFVFATHEPLLTAARKLTYRVLPIGPYLSLVYYLMLPLIVLAFSASTYFILARAFPRFTNFVTGHRKA